MAVSAMVVCSPVARSTSISRSVGFGETCVGELDEAVGHAAHGGDDDDDAGCPASCVAMTRRATLRMRSGLPTEVPPYFWTIRDIEKAPEKSRAW